MDKEETGFCSHEIMKLEGGGVVKNRIRVVRGDQPHTCEPLALVGVPLLLDICVLLCNEFVFCTFVSLWDVKS